MKKYSVFQKKMFYRQIIDNQFLTFVGILILLFFASSSSKIEQLSVSELTTEYLVNPIGLDYLTPRFSWVLTSTNRGETQSAYQIVVSKSRDEVESGTGGSWDTGRTNSGQSINIPYKGDPLESGEKYYWRVRVWDDNERQSSWSSIQTFQMGILNDQEWQAKWIGHPDTSVSAPLLRTEFNIEKKVESAWIYVTGVGYYELYLNGERVGDHVLDPGVTDHRVRVLYETYDVTDQLVLGENAVGLMLGDGPFRIVKQEGRYAWDHHSLGAPRGLVQLHIAYSDGTEEVVISDDTWKTSDSPITYTSLFGGEDYDARLEQKGWNTPDFDDSAWSPAVVIHEYDVSLTSQLMAPIRVTQTLKPQTQTNPEQGIRRYDLGQNIPGRWQIKVEGERGTKIKIRGDETLNDSLFPGPLQPGDQLSTTHSYHNEVWTTYILKGDGVETYEPRFFYNAFRYIEVQIDHPEQLHSLEVEGRIVHSDLRRNGHFMSSDSLLNRIYQATRWSQKGNLHSVPTDCPHREKGAYNGDGQVIAETSIHDFYMQPFYRKWLNDMRDAQEENGRVPNTSPTVIGGMGGGIPWGSAYILIPWWMYQYYEDVEILSEHYPTMKFYLQYLENLAQNDSNPDEIYIIGEFGSYWTSLGEWEAPDQRNDPNPPVVSTYYWYLNNRTMAEVAEVLGKTEDRRRFLALADSIKQAFNEKFFDPDTNLYGWDEPYQTYLAFALAGDLVPDGYEEGVLNRLIHDIMITRAGHHGTGILGTKHLFPVLAHAGRADVLHSMVTKTTFPSWGYWIVNGMTTLGERWNGEASQNHQMFGSVNEYFYKYLAGIRAPTDRRTSPGYKEIFIQPYMPEDLTYAGASLETIRGKVVSRWRQEAGRLRLEVSLPVNTSGKVSIPVSQFDHERIVITEQGKKLWEREKFVEGIEGISTGIQERDYITFDLKSGDYEFELAMLD